MSEPLPHAAEPVTAVVVAGPDAENDEEHAPATQSQQRWSQKRGIEHFLAGGAVAAADGGNLAQGSESAKKQKKEPDTRVVEYNGKHVTVFQGSHAAEDLVPATGLRATAQVS